MRIGSQVLGGTDRGGGSEWRWHGLVALGQGIEQAFAREWMFSGLLTHCKRKPEGKLNS